ncbi:AAA family ATPase [Mycobacteroides salmoniphilum]|uniref:AAA family ATPase n=1 Tax=Mycobacteroides salmoniphilum TaxID=404941 RepID=UPI001065FB5F|nr:AAA family ATPase [Mycobacteroides salmoniphilum]TDZ94681.1 vitamin B12-transporter ATPase [Mycobacteroides salmoniphilum]
MILRQIAINREKQPDAWYLEIPAIAQIAREPLRLTTGVTVIVGENGSGKSTLLEAVASSWRSRLPYAVRHWGAPGGTEDTDLYWAVTFDAEHPRPGGGCFLRAEAMHQLFATVDQRTPEQIFDGRLNERSHGESFLAFLAERDMERGLFILDEPEAALSFTSSLQLMAMLDAVVAAGSQVMMATHSPVLAAFPGATILEFGEDGVQQCDWNDLEMVGHWQRFLSEPHSYLRHLFEAE